MELAKRCVLCVQVGVEEDDAGVVRRCVLCAGEWADGGHFGGIVEVDVGAGSRKGGYEGRC